MYVNGRRQSMDELLARMEMVRGRLDDDAQAARQSVHELTDWRNIVRKHPLACVAAAAAAGFLLVPQKSKAPSLTAKDIERLAKEHKVILAHEPAAKSGLLGAITAIAGAALTRAASTYLSAKVNEMTQVHQRQES